MSEYVILLKFISIIMKILMPSLTGKFMCQAVMHMLSFSVHLCNVYGDSEIHQALHLFPEEGSFCIFSLTFSSDNKEILGG